jgi:hypothetical protein
LKKKGPPPKPVEELFWPKVRRGGPDECWLWTAHLNSRGYGQWTRTLMNVTKTYKAHRVAYELLRGPIPKGLSLDHLCRTPACVNPAHMEPVPVLTNILRGGNAAKTHCNNGHPLSGSNIVIIGRHRRRVCLVCRSARMARHKAMRSELRRAWRESLA